MKLEVSVSGRPVAVLESPDGFEHIMTYYPNAAENDFVSLLMPVRTKSYNYPELHPQFQMNLPEGFLLSILQQQLGPHVGASPLDLLSIIGRNMIGRVQVAVPGANLAKPPEPVEVSAILKGDNSEEAFVELVKRYATSGVSGIVPKFLTPQAKAQFKKLSVATPRYIIKGSSHTLPYVALNEYLSMMVCNQAGFDTAKTEISDDGQALIVHRFDVNETGLPAVGMEDLCALLSLRPAEKYDATWERVIKQVKAFVPKEQQSAAMEKLVGTLLMTYAIGNADCHTKNLALIYSTFEDVRLSPIYDMLSITIYDDYALNPPGLSMAGRKTWSPRNALPRFTQAYAGIMPAKYKQIVEAIGEGMVKVIPEVIAHCSDKPGFRELGKRMMNRWNDGMNSLNYNKSIVVPDLKSNRDAAGFSETAKVNLPRKESIGRSDLLASRKK